MNLITKILIKFVMAVGMILTPIYLLSLLPKWLGRRKVLFLLGYSREQIQWNGHNKVYKSVLDVIKGNPHHMKWVQCPMMKPLEKVYESK
jgi:hypothetical protein